jgi:hypothetical protein
VLSQYGLLHALAHEQDIARLMILNTPLATKTKLRPELAAYKNPIPFLRPGSKPFDGVSFNASGSPYAMQQRDADVYGRPYQTSPEASVAVAETMERVSCGGELAGRHASSPGTIITRQSLTCMATIQSTPVLSVLRLVCAQCDVLRAPSLDMLRVLRPWQCAALPRPDGCLTPVDPAWLRNQASPPAAPACLLTAALLCPALSWTGRPCSARWMRASAAGASPQCCCLAPATPSSTLPLPLSS